MTKVNLRSAYATWIQQDNPTKNWFGKTGYMSLYGKSGRANYGIVWFANPFPRSGGNVLRATLTLKTRKVTGRGSSQIIAQLCKQWSSHFGTVNWNTRPAGKLAQASLSKTNPLAEGTSWTFDVTGQMQAVANGEPFYGFILSTTSQHQILVQGNMSAALDPHLAVEFIESPFPPDDLAPSTGQAVGTPSPVLRMSYKDYVGGDVLSSLQVRCGTTEDTVSGSPFFDSGEVASTLPQLDLSQQPGWTPPAADTVVWWQARCKDSSGTWSGWSDPVSWQWHARPVVTLVQPEPSPSEQLGPELLTNGSFDSDVSGWSGDSGVSGLSGWARFGDGSPHSTPGFASTKASGATMTQTVAVTAGAHRLSVWSICPTTDVVTVSVTPAGGTAVSATVPLTSAPVAGKWAQTILNVTIPAGVTQATVAITHTSGAAWVSIDDVSLRAVTPGLPSFTDPTPPIKWKYTGDMPQTRWRASVSILKGSTWVVVDSSGMVVSDETDWTPKVGLAMAGRAKIIVDVFDDRAREATPGFPIYASASSEFEFQPVTTVEAAQSLEVVPDPAIPVVTIRWKRSEVPDRWDVYRDDMLLTRHEGLDFLVSGGQYEVRDMVCPGGPHRWTIFAIVNGKASKSSYIEETIDHPGIWLVDEETQERVWIQGDAAGHDINLEEENTVLKPLGGGSTVVVTNGLYGYGGTISGVLVDQPWMPATETAKLWRERLLKWRANPGHALRILIEDMDFRAAIYDVQVRGVHPFVGTRWSVTMSVHQTDDFMGGEK